MLTCCVCNIPFRGGEDGSVTRCGHCFHADCLRFYLGRSQQCPECDTNIAEADVRSVYLDSPSTRGTNPSTNAGNRNETQSEINRMLREMEEMNRRDVSTLPGTYELENPRPRSNYPVAEMRNHGVIINCNEYSPVVVNVDLAIPLELLLLLFL